MQRKTRIYAHQKIREVLHTSDCISKSPPLPISGMVKAKLIRYVQEKYNLSCYKHLQLYDNENHCP